MRFLLPLLVTTQLLSTVAIPLLLPSRDSTNLDAHRTLYARTNHPYLSFPVGTPPTGQVEIRNAFRNQLEHGNALAGHEAEANPGKYGEVEGTWAKDEGADMEHVSVQFRQGLKPKRSGPGPPRAAIGPPVKIYRDLTVDFDESVPVDQQLAIGAAVRTVQRGLPSGHVAKTARVAKVDKGWHQPTSRDPQLVVANYKVDPPSPLGKVRVVRPGNY